MGKLKMKYIQALSAATEIGLIPGGKITDVFVEHDDRCCILSGGTRCTCSPTVWIEAASGARITLMVNGFMRVPIAIRDGIPVFEATVKNDQLIFRCPKCGELRHHGVSDGHRVSHCANKCWPHGYFIQQRKK